MNHTSLWTSKVQLKTSAEIMFTKRPKKLDTTDSAKTGKVMNTRRMFGLIFFLIETLKVIRRLQFQSYFDLYWLLIYGLLFHLRHFNNFFYTFIVIQLTRTMPKTKSWPARPALTERSSRRPQLHTAARDETQTVVQPTPPQASTSPVELSAPQSPTTSVSAIQVTEPTVPEGNLTLVSLN